MYNLTNKAINLLEESKELRFSVALAMGNNDNSVLASIKRNNGKAIAEHFDAMNVLLDKTGLIVSDLRKQIKATA